tara:strand:- start:3364 stop:8436 length:5073 start_codon:yes stop_codon:yes gene_type:complete
LVKYIKNLISELSSTSDPVDLDEEAFVKETGSTVIKKDLNVSISNSLFFAGHTSSNFLGAHLSMDSAFKFPSTGYDNAIEDKFSIDFQQYTLSDTNIDAEIFFDIVEKDSSIAQAVNLIPSQSSIAHVGGKPQIARGIAPYRSGYGGSSYLFGDPEHGTISHPSGTYSSPSSTSSTTTVEERASAYGTDSGSYLISSLNVLDSSKSTHISMGGWYRKNDPQAQATISGYNNHSYSTSNFSYQSIDDGLDNIAMVHTNGIRIRGLDWSYYDSTELGAYQIGKHLNWENITTDIDLTAPKMGYLTVNDMINTYEYKKGAFLYPDSDRLYRTNDVINSNYLTGKRNIITSNFDTYNDATFAGYVWLDSSPINNKTIFKVGSGTESLELKVSGNNLHLSAGNGYLACSLPMPLNQLEADTGTPRRRGNRWHEVRMSVKLQPAEITLMTKKIGNLPSYYQSDQSYFPNGKDDIQIANHKPNNISGLLRWATGGPGGISEFKVWKNQPNMGTKHEGDRRIYSSFAPHNEAFGSPGLDPFRTDVAGNLFLRLGEKRTYGYSVLSSDGGLNDNVVLSNCGTISNLNVNGRIIYFEIQHQGPAGNLDNVLPTSVMSGLAKFTPFLTSSNMVHQLAATSSANTFNAEKDGQGNRIKDHIGYPNSYLFPTISSTKSLYHAIASYIIDEQSGHMHTYKDGVYISSVDFTSNIGADTSLELGFQCDNKWIWSWLINYANSATNPSGVAGINNDPLINNVAALALSKLGARYGTGTTYEGSYKAWLDDATVKQQLELKVALIKKDWVYDPVKLVNDARASLSADLFLNDGVYYSSTGPTEPHNINPFIDQTILPGENVRNYYFNRDSYGSGSREWPLSSHLLYYKEAYTPAITTDVNKTVLGETDEYKNSHVSWAGRLAKYEGSEHGINKARAYILKTGGSLVSYSTPGDITSTIAGMTNGDCLLLEPGNYSVTAVNGGAWGITTAMGTNVSSVKTPFGTKNIMICGNTNNIKLVHINYTGGVGDVVAPVFGPNQNENTELAFLTFKKFDNNSNNPLLGHTALSFQSTGAAAYKVLFDLSGVSRFTWSYIFDNTAKTTSILGSKTTFNKCVFSNYVTAEEEASATIGGSSINFRSNIQVIDPIFSKASGIADDILNGTSIDTYRHTSLEPWWNNNDFSGVKNSNIITSQFKGYMKDFHLYDDIADNRIADFGAGTDSQRSGGWNIVNSGNNFHNQADSYIIYSYSHPPNLHQHFGLPNDSYSTYHLNSWNNDLSGYASIDSSFKIMGGIEAEGGGEFKGGTLLSLDTLGQIVVSRNANYNYSVDQREMATYQAQDSSSISMNKNAKWIHNAITVDSDKIRIWRDGSQFDSAFGPFYTKHLSIKDAKLYIGAGNQVKGRTFGSLKDPQTANQFKSYNGYLKDFRIQTGLQFADSFELFTTDQTTAVGNTVLLSNQTTAILPTTQAGSRTLNNVASITGDIVSIKFFSTDLSSVAWRTTSIINTENVDLNASGIVTLDALNQIVISRPDSDFPFWGDLLESGDIGYIPGLQAKMSMLNKDDDNNWIDWQVSTSQLFEPIVQTTKDSQYSNTNFYFNDYHKSEDSFEARPSIVFGSITGKNRYTDSNPAIYIDRIPNKSRAPVKLDFTYDRNNFNITNMSTDHILRFAALTHVPQGGFATDGISSFDAYQEGGLLFNIIDSVGGLTI